MLPALLHGCSTVNLLYCGFAEQLFRRTPLGHCFCVLYLCFGANNKWHILLTSFYNLQTRICILIKNVLKVFCIFLLRSLVKQISVVTAEAFPYRCSSKRIIWSISAINVKRNIYFYFILFSFDQNLNFPKYGA